MDTLFKINGVEVVAAIVIFFLGWAGGIVSSFTNMADWIFILFANLFMACGMYLGIHALYSGKIQNKHP